MKWLRRILITLLVLAMLGVAGWFTMPYWLPLVAKRLEPYIRSELTGIIGEYLKPEVTIESINYQWPLTVVAGGVRMTAKVPGTDRTVDIVSVDKMKIVLDRIPKAGEPLVFRDFTLNAPNIILHATKSGELVGWDDLLKETGEQSDGRKASEIFAIDQISVTGFGLEYSLEGVEDNMTLDELDFTLDNRGKSGDQTVKLPQGPGWYAVNTILERPGLFSIDLAAGLNIDNLDTEIEKLKIDLQVNEKARSFLPPQIQSFCERHQIESHLDITARAKLNLLDIDQSDVTAQLEFGPSHVAVGDKVLNIESATSDLVYKDSTLSITPMKISTLGGTITGSTTIMAANSKPIPAAKAAPLTTMSSEDAENLAKVANLVPEATAAKIEEVASSLDFNLQLDIDKLKMQEIHRLQETGKQEEGLVNGKVDIHTNLGAFLPAMTGKGEINITDGRFEMNALLKALAGIMKVVVLDFGGKDSLEGTFTIGDQRVTFSSFKALIGPIGARGRGWIAFDETLQLKVNAGPIERMQESLGFIGGIFGALTDTLLDYIISGTLQDPKVRIAPLGIDFGMRLPSEPTFHEPSPPFIQTG